MIFDKSNNGSEEVKAALGFVHASLNFDNLKNFIPFAKKDLLKVIGKEVYELAEDHYKSENFEGEDFADLNELVKLIQTVIAYHAYRRYVKSNDLTHSETGRQITVTETDKPAFEWMVDKDDSNLLSLANETLELLLDYLDEQLGTDEPSDIGNAWMESAAFKNINSCMVNRVEEFEKVFVINSSRRIFLMLAPFLRKAERAYIPGAIMMSRYSAIIEAIKDGDLSEEQEAIRELATPVIVNFALSKALKVLPVESLPDVFGEKFIADKLADIDTDARLGAAQVFENEAKLDYSRLQRHIKYLTPIVEEEPENDTTQPFFMF